MTLSHPHPQHMALDLSKRVLPAPNSLISSSSSSAVDRESLEEDEYVSDTDSAHSSVRSSSDTYLTDFGGAVVRDDDWPEDRVSREHAFRVYESTDDEFEARRQQARRFLDASDIGVYDEWAEIADDELSLEDLQEEANKVAKAIEGFSMNEDALPDVGSIESLDDEVVTSIPIVEMLDEGSKKPTKPAKPAKPPRRRKGHKRVVTLQDDEFPDAGVSWNGREESVEASSNYEDLEIPQLPTIPPLPKSKKGKRRHRRIETLQDLDDLELEQIDPNTSEHRRIETLPDGDAFGTPPSPPLKRVEILDDSFDMSTPPPLPTPPSFSGVESLPDQDDTPDGADLEMTPVSTPNNHTKIEVLPDERAPSSENGSLDRRRGSLKHEHNDEVPEQTDAQRVESLPNGDVAHCPKLSDLSERVAKVTRGLAAVQMATAGRAASAEACLGKMNKTSLSAEICRLRITLDHLAKLTLERAFSASDEVDRHRVC